MRKISRSLSLSKVLLALPLVVACGDDGTDDDDTDDDLPTETASLRVVHASAGAPAVDIYAEGIDEPLIADLAYGEASAYIEVPAGTYNVQVRAAGAPITDAPVYQTGDLTLAADATVTAIAAGDLASDDEADSFRVLALAEGFGAAGEGARVRVVHAGYDAPTVGIDVGNDDPAAPELDGLARFADSGEAGVELPAGSALQLGIAAGDETVTAFTTPALPEGGELFVIAVGRLGELPRQATGFSLLAVGPSGVIGRIPQNPTVFALHASPDAPTVDIREASGDGLLVGALEYGQLGQVQVPPGSYTLDFYGAGAEPGTPAASAETPALAAGERYLAIASGFLSPIGEEEPFQLLAFADEFALEASGARVRAVHASPDAPEVDIGTATGLLMDDPRLLEDVPFTAASGGEGLEVPAANLTLGIAAAGAANAAAAFDVTTADGLRTFAVAMGALSASKGEESFELGLVITSTWPWSVARVQPNGK